MINIYLNKLLTLSHNNKYTKWYNNIVLNCIERQNSKFFIKNDSHVSHHILPKSFKLGGEKDKENLVFLTYREHFLVHMILPKMLIDKTKSLKMSSALSMMNYRNKINSRLYETGMLVQSKYSFNRTKEKQEKTKNTLHSKYGVEHNSQLPTHKETVQKTCQEKYGVDWPTQIPEVKEKVKNTCQEKYGETSATKSPQTQQKKRETNKIKYGFEQYSQTDEYKIKVKNTCQEKYGVDNVSQVEHIKLKMAESIKNSWVGREKIICPHCQKESTNKSRMDQYHFDNCKLSPNYIQPELITCPHCLIEGKETFQFKQYHFKNCKLSPNYIQPELITCPHCNKQGQKANMIQWHFEKCKYKNR